MARSKPYRENAVVVRTYDFGEADRIIVLLTQQHGVVRAVAKGVRRAKSRFGSRLAPFVHLNVQLYPGRNLDTITGADTVAFFATGIIDDYERYTAGCAMLEAAERLAQPPRPRTQEARIGEAAPRDLPGLVAVQRQAQGGACQGKGGA